MRATRACSILTTTIVLGRALVSGQKNSLGKSETSNSKGLWQEDRVSEQKIVMTVVTSETRAAGKQDILDEDERSDSPKANEHNIHTVVTRTSESAVTVSHPKITEAPSLLKRKLGSNHWDIIHQGIQGQKRDATQCPADYQLCPKSLNGGCCPNERICGASSCLPASAAPASACGELGHFACGISDGGGCCPTGYVCGQAGCSPSAGVTNTQTCGINSYLCPASLNYGCCQNGMGCEINGCYSTSISTFTLVETFITTDASSNLETYTSTIVSATTPATPTATVSSDAGLIAKLPSSATAIPKTDPTGSPSTSSSSLTKPMIGGIIGGAVGFLIIVLIGGFFIMRRLNTVIKVNDATNSRTSSSGPRSGRSQPRAEALDIDEINAMSVDPLMMTGSEASGSIRRPSYQSRNLQSSLHEVEGTPPLFNPNSPFSPPPHTYYQHTHYPGGYNQVSTSDSLHYRNSSLDSTPPSSQNPIRDYFDIPVSHRSSQGSIPTRQPSQHSRNYSNASDQSQVSQMSDPAELEAGPQEAKRSKFQKALFGLGMGRMVSRRRSEPPVLSVAPNKKVEWKMPATQTLGHIPEASESQYQFNSPESILPSPDSNKPLIQTVNTPSNPPQYVNTTAHPQTRQRGLSTSQLREAGLSNSQLREMTMFDANLYIVEEPQTISSTGDPEKSGL